MNRRSLVPLPSIAVACAALAAVGASAQTLPDGPYFGQTPPGLTPEVFAPGVISLDTRYEYSIAFSPDLTECAFGVTNNFWSAFQVLSTTMASDSSWSMPATAPFLGSGDGLSAVYTPDGQSVYFASMRPSYPPANLWAADRDSTGAWMAPVKVPSPVNTLFDEYAPSFTSTGVLYFVSYRPAGNGSADIYRAAPVGGTYPTVVNIGPPVNGSSLDSTPCIAPDESFLLFESNRVGGYGQHDIYVSYRVGGSWSEPVNLGPEINTDQIEDEPYITPDGKYLFFNRRAAFVTGQQTDLYWVDIDALVDPTAATTEGLGAASGVELRQNAPNPFRPRTRIEYALPSAGFVTIQVLDVRGREVRRLVKRRQEAGAHTAVLSAEDTRTMAAGPYFYRLIVDGRTLTTRKMTLLK
jgi:hypothetical protein